MSCLIHDIIKCFEQRYGDLLDEAHIDATNTVKETTEGDRVLSHICKVWPNEVEEVEEVMMKKQLSSVKAIYNQYCQMPIFQATSFQQIKAGHLQLIKHAATFFPIHLTPPLKLWQNIFELSSSDYGKDDWKPVLPIVELVMFAPQSNAVLERFFSQLNYIKTNILASPSRSSLNSLLCTKVTGLALQEYHNEHVEVVEF